MHTAVNLVCLLMFLLLDLYQLDSSKRNSDLEHENNTDLDYENNTQSDHPAHAQSIIRVFALHSYICTFCRNQ